MGWTINSSILWHNFESQGNHIEGFVPYLTCNIAINVVLMGPTPDSTTNQDVLLFDFPTYDIYR